MERIQGFIENKKYSPEKVSIIWHIQIDTFPTQKLEFIHLELTCPRPEQQKFFFWQMQKLRISISNTKSYMFENSTVFQFFYIF